MGRFVKSWINHDGKQLSSGPRQRKALSSLREFISQDLGGLGPLLFEAGGVRWVGMYRRIHGHSCMHE